MLSRKGGELVFRDLREYIREIERHGGVTLVNGADWDLEIGLITEWQSSVPENKLLLFDNIKDYPSGFRVATNLYSTLERTALALGLPPGITRMELVGRRSWL